MVTYSLSLPGGVQLTASTSTDHVWSYPNLHGDVILTADKDGVRVGDRYRVDPFGQPIAADGTIGTTVGDDTVADNSDGQADHAWVGQGRLSEALFIAPLVATIGVLLGPCLGIPVSLVVIGAVAVTARLRPIASSLIVAVARATVAYALLYWALSTLLLVGAGWLPPATAVMTLSLLFYLSHRTKRGSAGAQP